MDLPIAPRPMKPILTSVIPASGVPAPPPGGYAVTLSYAMGLARAPQPRDEPPPDLDDRIEFSPKLQRRGPVLERIRRASSDTVSLEEIAGDLGGRTAGCREVEEQIRFPSGMT